MSSTLPPNRDFYSPFWSKPDDIEVVKTISARSTTLDALAEAEGLWPDALKIDVQGGEGAVLQGSAQALDRSVLLAEVECSFAERYEGQKTIDQVMQFMRERGFALLDLRRLKRYRYRNAHQVADVPDDWRFAMPFSSWSLIDFGTECLLRVTRAVRSGSG
jgi:hypothetical protein